VSPHRTFGLGLAAVVLVLDQATKWWMLEVVGIALRPPIEVTPFFNLVMVWNRGVSFGLFAHEAEVMPYVLSGVAVAIAVALLVWLARAERRWIAAAIGLVVGGAVGNVIDRLRFGAVADFFDVHVAGWHWPAFNVADAAIVVGVGMILLDGFATRHHNATDRRD
jgi:signal peptidase II